MDPKLTDDDLEFIAEEIADGKTSGMFDPEDDERVSWSITIEKFKLTD